MVFLQQVYRIEGGGHGKVPERGKFLRGRYYCRKGKGSCVTATAAM